MVEFLTKSQINIKRIDAKVAISKDEIQEIHDKAYDAVVMDSLLFNVFEKTGMKLFIEYLKKGY